MCYRSRPAQGCPDRDVASRRGVRKHSAHRRDRTLAEGIRPRRCNSRAQRSGRVLRGAVAISKDGLMGERVAGAHTDLHSDQGARQGEHPGRSRDPIIKVHDIAWLEFEKPDLVRAEAFSRAFGFSTALCTDYELYLRGTDPGSPCVLIRQGPRSRFVAAAYTAQDQSDVRRLAEATGARVRALPGPLGGGGGGLVYPRGVAD